ncbi:MAG: hypothetical protein ABIP94_11300 [Planctomycetota bacterium]
MTGNLCLLASRAPANSLGATAVGNALPAGTPVLDLLAYVDLGSVVLAPLVADAQRRALLSVPLGIVGRGQQFAVQALWPTGNPCTALGLQASHALQLSILAP